MGIGRGTTTPAERHQMTEETFTCDRCGRDFPRRQLKEVFNETESKRLQLCPECLDAVMNTAGEVEGVPGDEKQAAARISDLDEPT